MATLLTMWIESDGGVGCSSQEKGMDTVQADTRHLSTSILLGGHFLSEETETQ